LSDLSSRTSAENDQYPDDDAVAPKKSRVDVSESCDENEVLTDADTDKPSAVSESGICDLDVGKCSSGDDGCISTICADSSEALKPNNLSSCQTQYQDSSVQAVCSDTSQAVDGSMKVEDCWWNKVDSRTWLQGLQSYLLLHSAADVGLGPVPVAVFASNFAPYTMIANPASHIRAVTSVAAQSAVAKTTNKEHQYVRPALASATGFRVLTNRMLPVIPVCYFPVVNRSVRGLSPSASAVGTQQVYIGEQQSSLAAVDLVSFMHNYCLPPSSISQSSVNFSVVQARNAVGQQLIHSAVSSPSEAPGISLMTDVSQQTENDHLSSWLVTPASSALDNAGFLSSSSVCLTPTSLSSNSSTESCTDGVLELSACSSTIAVSSCESGLNINTGSVFSANADLTLPGWFGKGLSIRRSKRRLSRQS